MNAKVDDLMVPNVKTIRPEDTLNLARDIMTSHNIHSVPVTNGEGEAVGILTATDLLEDQPGDTPVSAVMTRKVYTVPQYADVHIAARIMRNHHLHHVLVTHEQKITGILSSFDMLRLVENHRFVLKNPPTKSKRGGKRQ